MATDNNKNWGNGPMRGDPFSLLVGTADASGNGVEVVPAVTGKNIYVLGYQITNETGGGLNYYIAHTAAASGKTAIGVVEYVAATITTDTRRFEPPIAGSDGKNVGIVASGSGATDVLIWGYYGE